MTEVIITPFDNDISILYKWARYYKLPINLIIIDPENPDQYLSSINYIQSLNLSNLSNLSNLYNIYDKLSDKMELIDIVMIYTQLRSITTPLDNILLEINLLYNKIGEDIIENVDELQFTYEQWQEKINNNFTNDMENLNDLELVHQELNKYPELYHSPLKLDKVIIKSQISNKTIDDALVIFNDSIPSSDVPYIRYNGANKNKPIREELFKLYRGKSDEEMPNYKIIIPPTSQTIKDNSFYLTVWSGKGSLAKATKEAYLKAHLNLIDNSLIVKTPVETKSSIINKIETSLNLKITNINETGISGDLFIYDVDINDIYLVDMIINTDLMNSYLFVKENTTSYAEKSQLKLYYKSFTGVVEEEEKSSEGYIINPSSVTVSITQHYASGGEIVSIVTDNISTDDGIIKFSLTPNLPYIRLKITQAESVKVANQFIKIFSRLLSYYKHEVPQVELLFQTYIPELKPEINPVIVINKVKILKDTKIEKLKKIAPDMFVSGYARKCQRAHQPIIISPNEISKWGSEEFVHKDTTKKRQVMSFPPENPKYYFGCPDDTVPFPGVKINTLSNKEIYPCLPCCFKDDQMDPKASSNYNKCFKKSKAVKKEELTTKESHKIKTDKIAGPNRYGFVSKSIADIVSKYSPDFVDIVRMGVPRSYNSLLHCVSIAVQDPKYLELNIEERELYVIKLRNIIAGNVKAELLKQEMYDYNDQEIKSLLSNPEVFMDPNLFYRAIEETYNINLYVFSPPTKDMELGSFELPRFKLFHSRVPRPERLAILILRTWGNEADALDYPQCELIVDHDADKNKTVYAFGSNMNNILHNALITLNRTITWELVPAPDNKREGLIARNNIYSKDNYYYLLNKMPTEQIIDGFGKTRAFIFPFNNQKVTVIVPSTQPENLPIGQITRCDYLTAIELFGDPSSVTKSEGGIDGFWYKIVDMEYGLYIPIIPINLTTELPIGISNPLVEEGTNIVTRVRKLKRDLDIILQIVKWLYILSGETVDDFMINNSIIGPSLISGTTTGDSSMIYDLSKVGIKLPASATLNAGLKDMELIAPTLIKNGKIFMYSRKFYDGVLYFLKKYDYEVKHRIPTVPKVIYRDNISGEHFTQQSRVAIFTDEKDMRTWLNTLSKISFENIIIENKLNISNALRTEPYLYAAPTGNIYMIQNVIGGEKSRALKAAYYWFLYKINPGHNIDPISQAPTQAPIHVVYGISPALAPVLVENYAGDAVEYLQILSYGSNQYAAMLQLI